MVEAKDGNAAEGQEGDSGMVVAVSGAVADQREGGAEEELEGEGGMVVVEGGAVAVEVEDAVVAEGCGEVLGAVYKGEREEMRGVLGAVWSGAQNCRFWEGRYPFGGIGGGAPESWRTADSNLATIASNKCSLLDFSVSDA